MKNENKKILNARYCSIITFIGNIWNYICNEGRTVKQNNQNNLNINTNIKKEDVEADEEEEFIRIHNIKDSEYIKNINNIEEDDFNWIGLGVEMPYKKKIYI